MKKNFNYDVFDLYMKDEVVRTYICQVIADDQSIKNTILLNCETYLDSIDLSFHIHMYIAYDKQNSYFIIGAGEENPSVFNFFQQKIIRQIGEFNNQAKVFCLYIDTLHSGPKDIS